MSSIRKRNNKFSYKLEAILPITNEHKKYTDISTLEELSAVINVEFFNGFPVVSRAMINNWLYYPDRPRRMFGDFFKIDRVSA